MQINTKSFNLNTAMKSRDIKVDSCSVNIDDDLSCHDARIRFGLALNNESSVSTLNDTLGFGASSYYTSDCDLALSQDSPWSTGAGLANGSNIESTQGHIWIR